LGFRAVETADPIQPSQDIGHMRTEDTSIGVKFINHHKLQILKEGNPFRMMREDAGVEHVGVGDHNIPLRADGLSSILRCVPVIGEGRHRFSDPIN